MVRITQPRIEHTTKTIEGVSIEYDTYQPETDKYKVAKMDSQTAGNSMEMHVTRDVVERIKVLQDNEDIAGFGQSLEYVRGLVTS